MRIRIKTFAAALACAGMLLTPLTQAASPVTAPRDVALQQGGVLSGQLLDQQGAPQVNAPVSIQTGSVEVARVTTDQQGKFTVSGLRGGVHYVASAGHRGNYRFWAPQTAPPAAQRGLLMVDSNATVRGQHGGGALGFVADHPVFTAAAIGTAIAVPIAITDDDDPPPATP